MEMLVQPSQLLQIGADVDLSGRLKVGDGGLAATPHLQLQPDYLAGHPAVLAFQNRNCFGFLDSLRYCWSVLVDLSI